MSPFSPPSHRCHYSDIDPTCRVAHLGDRLIAAALDHLVVFGMCAVVTVWSFTRWSFVGPSEFQLTTASLLIAGMLSEACAFLYLWLFEAAFEASLGKMIVGLGPLAACAIRNALRLIEAGTAVVEETFPAGVKALAILVWTAAMATSVWACREFGLSHFHRILRAI